MNTAKIFKNGQSQAVRLPKEFRFTEDDVYINKIGDVVLLYPKKSPWDSLEKSLDLFTDDFLEERNQPKDTDIRSSL
ncbi:antitoxin [Patescibacteria group bacterium]|nr:antitoxin [Patescibacteria group bacterium]MBU1721755.1 antitoxin [Patescibacteria group bacterium]MBU1901406.1 antitoxin [Patescibacteria group bacterium]